MYTHFSRDDRSVISSCQRQGDSYEEMGKRIGKTKSAVWKEIYRNKDPDGVYRVWSAERKAKERRKNSKVKKRLIENNNELSKKIEERISPLVSPEVVAYEEGIHHQCIYDWIKRSRPELKKKLPRQGKRRRKYGSKREGKQGWTKHVRSIDERIEKEENWEGDTLQGSSKSGLLTYVERRSLFTFADQLIRRTADNVHEKTRKHNFSGTITYDRGSEFALWRMIERDTSTVVYFAHPQSPWERPKNENTNERFRRVFKKGCDFSKITQKEIDKVTWIINHTPRKSLNWRTSCEVYGKCCTSE